ncbi:MAG: PaaI family thioesterase [Bacteroidales bacterium]|nr:PaaI family thioesterase [Bacteroidales bacterium]
MRKIVNPWTGLDGYNCIGCSPDNPFGLHLCFYEEGDDVVCHWQPSENYQGWLNTLHGGIQVLILDEVCGWVVTRKLQTAGVTSKMETRYRRPVSTDAGEITARAHLRELRRNIAIIDAQLLDDKGVVCTEATCTYFAFPKEKAEKEMFFRDCLVEGE